MPKKEKKKKPKTHIWIPILFFFFLLGSAGAVIGIYANGSKPNPEGYYVFIPIIVLLGILWWRTRHVDSVLLARSPEKQIARLEKIRDMKKLLKIAEKADPPVCDEALMRITDQNVFLEAAKKLDTFAAGQITDPKMLFSMASDPNFFRGPKHTESYREYKQQCYAIRKSAVDRILDASVLLDLASSENDMSGYALARLIREYPDLACSLCMDNSTPAKVRSDILHSLVANVEKQIKERPETAAVFLMNRSLPVKARLAATKHIDDPELLFSCYDPGDNAEVRESIVYRMHDQGHLMEIADREPDPKIRVIAELRVTDPEKRKEYCARGEAHDWEELDHWWELYGDYHYEKIRCQCRICGAKWVKEGDSFKD